MTDSTPARRRFLKARRVVVKVGTSVVTREDGTLALGRLASLVEQIAELVRDGKQVALVASGAIGIGQSRLAEQAMLSRSIRSALHAGEHHEPHLAGRITDAALMDGREVCVCI